MRISINSPTILVGTLFLASVQTLVKCEVNCDDNSKLQYEVGKSYVYNLNLATYDSEEKRMLKSEKDTSHISAHSAPYNREHPIPQTAGQIETKGRVVLTALENCEYVLTLSQVTQELAVKRYSGNVPYTAAQINVPRTSVKFTFKNGEVSGLLASQNGGEPWTHNILRGILTIIQNKAMNNADGEPEEREINIKGDCMAHVKIPNEGTYRKTIQMSQCSEAMISPSSDGVAYTNPIYSPVSTLHQLRSFMSCSQTVENGLLQTANCTEQDEVPIMKARMDTLTSLQLLSNETAQEPEKVGGATTQEISTLTLPTTINYDTRPNTLGEGQHFVESIAEVAKTMYSDPDANKAELFLKLKDMLASVKDFAELETSLAKAVGEDDILQKQFIKNIIREVATEVGTEAAVVFLANLVNELEWSTMISFYNKLPYSRHPTLNGLRVLISNLEGAWLKYQNDTYIAFKFDEKKKLRKIMLGTSAYAYQFCRSHPDCGEVKEYQQLVNQISQFCDSKLPEISPACAHALGNVEHLPATAVENVKNLLANTGNPLTGQYKKITAFEAFRRDPCQPELKNLARENLQNTQNNQELRIVAYMAVARCPQEEDLTVIDKILETEFDTPLSSFIATHVYNIMDSQSPSKFYLKSTPLGLIGIPENIPKVHTSPTSSRFVEYSSFRPEKNLGFSTDAYIIFKDDGSETPLFAHLNVTVDFLGKSYNKLQIGLSTRYFPSIEKLSALFKHGNKARWIGWTMIPALFGMDSYYRIFGTTVSMGLDVFDTFKSHAFFDKFEDKETGLMRLDIVKPFTLMDKDILLPTVAGIPVSFSAQVAYLPVLSINHTGDPEGLGIYDLFSKWDEKSGQFRHLSTVDSAIFGKVSVAAGKGTPLSMAYNVEAKIHCNHSIGYESMKNFSTNWVKKIEFPHKTIFSERVSTAITFSTTHWANQYTNWPVFGNMEEKEPENLFRFEHMGLRFTGDILHGKNKFLNADVFLKIEKTEDQFTGYVLDIETKERNGHMKSLDVALKADGLSTVDTLQLNFVFDTVSADTLENDGDRPKSEYSIRSEYTRVGKPASGFSFQYFSEGFPKTDLNLRSAISELEVSSVLSFISLGLLTRSTYRLEIDTTYQSNQYRLINWSIDNAKKNNAQITMKFEGPLTNSLGTISGQVSTPGAWQTNEIVPAESEQSPGITVNAELSHNSRDHGDNKVTLDFSHIDENTYLNTSANIHGETYHLTQRKPKDKVKTDPHFQNMRYDAHYDDTLNRKYHLRIGYDQHYEDKFYHNNGSLLLTGAPLPAPIKADVEIHKKQDRTETLFFDGTEAYSWLLNVDACGMTGNLLYNIKFNETSVYNEDNTWRFCNGKIVQNLDGDRCSTHSTSITCSLAEMYDVKFNFSNETPLKTELYLSAEHSHPNYGGDLHVIVERDESKPALLIKKATTATLNHYPNQEDKWQHFAITDIDLEKRTVALNSETSKNSQMNWTLKMDANWAERISDGDITVKVVHTCPAKKTVTVDILNQARSGEVFNNTLTAVLDVVGRTREFTPKKQFSWILITDGRMTSQEQDKHESSTKVTNDFRLQILGDGEAQPSIEMFHWKDDVQLIKIVGKDLWTVEETGNVMLLGKEKAAYYCYADLDTSEQPGDNAEVKTTDLALYSVQKYPRTVLNSRTDGWFETENPELRNNTWSSHYTYKFNPKPELEWSEDYDFLFKKKDEASGADMFTVNVNGTKIVKFKGLLHFSQFEKANIVVDNKTTISIKDIRVDGPHITLYIKHDSPETVNNSTNNNSEDSWLIDFAGGIYQERHQHKFNLRNSGSKSLPHHGSHHHHGHHHHHKDATDIELVPHHRLHPPGGFGLFRNNFNFTVSK